MFGRQPKLSPLESRKRLLIAESEINRVQLLDEWQAMAEGVHSLADRARSVRSLASAAASLVAGVSAIRREKAEANGAKPSWFRLALNGAQMAGDLWHAYRARKR